MERLETLPVFIGCEEYQEYFFKCEPTTEAGHYLYKGTTPNGGSSILFIFLRDGQKVTIDQAKFVELQELNQQGALIHIEHGKADIYDSWENKF